MIKSKRHSILIILFAWSVYMFSYLGRADYSACIVEIISTTGVARATAGMVTSVFSLCNSFGQIASGFLLKKVSPIKVIGAELFLVASINFLMPNCTSFLLMAILWGINGAMQSTLLCGATQIFMENLEEPWISRGAVLLNTVGAVGGTVNYILTWFLIRYANWQTVFLTVSAMLFMAGILWTLFMPKLTLSEKQDNAVTTSRKPSQDKRPAQITSFFSELKHYGTVFVLIGCFSIGLLRESVSLWVPSYINEVFGLSSSLSIISTVFVPCFQILGAFLGGSIGRKIYNLHLPSCIAFALSGVCMGGLLLARDGSLILSIILFVINAICMTAALTFLVSLFPIRFLIHTHVPLFVGIFNFFVHAGDFLASAGIGWLSQIGGWDLTFTTLCSVAFGAASICVAGYIQCRKELKRTK